MPAHAGIQDRERRAVERRLSGREPWIPAFAGTTHCRMALGWMDRDETRVGSCDAFALTAQTAYFSRKSRKKGCFGGMIGGIDGLASEPRFPGFVFAGLGGALASGGGSSGPYRPQAASISASNSASAGARARPVKRNDNAAATSDSGWSRRTIQKERAEARVEARPLQGNRAKAISSPLVGEDEGGGSHRTSKALFRPLLGDGRATPHPCPPPQVGRERAEPSQDSLRPSAPTSPWECSTRSISSGVSRGSAVAIARAGGSQAGARFEARRGPMPSGQKISRYPPGAECRQW